MRAGGELATIRLVGGPHCTDPAPILRWAGSKRALLRDLIARVPAEFDRYIEPFAGSACLFLALQPRTAVLADNNAELMTFYGTFRASPTAVLETAQAWPQTSETYKWVRALSPEGVTDIV